MVSDTDKALLHVKDVFYVQCMSYVHVFQFQWKKSFVIDFYYICVMKSYITTNNKRENRISLIEVVVKILEEKTNRYSTVFTCIPWNVNIGPLQFVH